MEKRIQKRSTCASGRGYVPTKPMGFWVAMTVKRGGTYTASAYRATPPQQRTTTYQSPYSYATTKRSSIPELNKGDMIQHTAFGRGMVLSAMKMGGDVLLEIAFDQIGTKKLMVKSASDHIKKL